MRGIKDISVKRNAKIIDVLEIIDRSAKQICLVLDDENRLVGTISDGDIRRGLLNNASIHDTVDQIFCKSPKVAHTSDSKEKILSTLRTNKIHQLPIVDNNNVVQGIEMLDDIISDSEKPNRVVLMVGGLGERLRPLTKDTPKPMLSVGDRPILQTIVEELASHGFVDIVMCVGYKSHVIQDFFGDGEGFGVRIQYVEEHKRMGTAGALSLITDVMKEPFLVMNGDLLTKVNFEHLLDFHKSTNAIATMCVREYDLQVPYGVVSTSQERIVDIQEKPVHNFFVNAGIYMLNPECMDLIPQNQFYDITSLFAQLINQDQHVVSFPLREYWLDIGRFEEYERANYEYEQIF